ncbi:hypothetical protein [Dactylosporangium sp. NPDC005555]|uniref:hypothetical protein n=1 Tax=Dactylosporangium sp. NPDC005555 TaxID=3154889 RepID=UPI0033B5B68B
MLQRENGLAVALVDFDNIVPGVSDSIDIEDGMRVITRTLRFVIAKHWAEVTELRTRMYGGWLRKSGLETRNATWIAPRLSDFRSTVNGLFIDPEIAYATLWNPRPIRGTFRFSSDREPDDPDRAHQKMVDSMIISDVINLAVLDVPVIIMTDDDDVVPGVMAYRDIAAAGAIMWLRRRPAGASCNDESLRRQGVVIETYAAGGV